MFSCFRLILFITGFLQQCILSHAAERPNIIFIVADDLGWNDVSFHGSPQIPTPHIDSIAYQGIILNNYYVCPLCSPSRGSLMTGLYPTRTGFTHDVLQPDEPWGLPLNFKILPQYLRELGYATHAVGKWHLGFYHKEYTPTYRGFDSHYGYWSHSQDYFTHVLDHDGMIGVDFRYNLDSVRITNGIYSTTLFNDRSVNIIQEHNTSKPLFLYIAYQAVHNAMKYAPLQAPLEYIQRFSYIKDKKRRVYAGMVSALDDSIGKVMQSLRDRNMLENSIVVFTTDNGGAANGFMDNAASNWPLRGVKFTVWEGGVRGVGVVWSPFLQEMNRVSMGMMHIADWLPTLYHAAGGDVLTLGEIDGHNMWESLSRNEPSPRTEVLHNIDPILDFAGLRVGDYKVVQGIFKEGQWDGWFGPSGRENEISPSISFKDDYFRSVPSYYDLTCGPIPMSANTSCQPKVKPCLFDVKEDPCEYYNLADERPEVLASLLERLEEFRATAVRPGNLPMDPSCDPKYYDYMWVNWKDYIN